MLYSDNIRKWDSQYWMQDYGQTQVQAQVEWVQFQVSGSVLTQVRCFAQVQDQVNFLRLAEVYEKRE